jgi:hypothetical protein
MVGIDSWEVDSSGIEEEDRLRGTMQNSTQKQYVFVKISSQEEK